MIGLKRGTVQLVDYDSSWAAEFEKEKQLLTKVLGGKVVRIEHIGSTAVPGLSAKPVIDIEVGLRNFDDYKRLIPLAEKLGYHFMPDRIFGTYVFMPKGADDCRTHYLHFAEINSSDWNNAIAFRDALRADSKLRNAYASLKYHLASVYEDRASYTKAKGEFIEQALAVYHKNDRADI